MNALTTDQVQPETDEQLSEGDTPKVLDAFSVSNTSILKRLIVSPDTYYDQGVCITFLGNAGSGKTTLACSVSGTEVGGTVLLLDAEAGSKVVRERIKNGTVIPARISKWTEISQITSEFKQNRHKGEFKTVVIDNLSEIHQQILANLCSDGRTPQFDEWHKQAIAMRQFIRDWRTIAETTGINVFFIGWEEETDAKEVRNIKRSIHFTPAMQAEFPGLVDTVGFLSPVDNKPELRTLDFTPSTKTIAKFRKSAEDNARKVPFKITYGLDTMPLTDMLATIRTGKPWPEAKYKKNEQ